MPGLYDIAAGLKTPSSFDLSNAQAEHLRQDSRLTRQSADYNDKTGNSESKQKDRQLDILSQEAQYKTDSLAFNIKKANEEMNKHASEDDKRALEAFNKNYSLASQVYEQTLVNNGGKQEAAIKAASDVLQMLNPQMPNNLRVTKYNPVMGDSVRALEGGDIEKLGPREINIPGVKPFNAEVWNKKGTDTSWITTEKGRVPLTSEQIGTPVPTTQYSGPLPQKEASDLRKMSANTNNYLATTEDFLTKLKQFPDLNTFTAKGASYINDFKQDAHAVGVQFGLKSSTVDHLLDPETYSSTFEALGIANVSAKGLFTSLAFQAAALDAEQNGRSVSEQDVKKFMTQVGATESSTKAIATNVRDVAFRLQRKFKFNYDEARKVDQNMGELPESESLARINKIADSLTGVKPNNSTVAPQSAIDHLKQHPELKDAFKAKFGYLP